MIKNESQFIFIICPVKLWKDFSLLQYRVRLWVGENRDRIRDLSLEECEELMIADGIITRDDI